MIRIKSIISFILLFSLLGGVQSNIYAQGPNEAFIQITNVDTQQFPTVKVYTYSEGDANSFQADNLLLKSNNVAQKIITSTKEVIGIQTALVIDLKATRYPKAVDIAVKSLSGKERKVSLDAAKDWLAAYGLTEKSTDDCGKDFEISKGWQQDHNSVINCLIKSQPKQVIANHTSFALLRFVLDQFIKDSTIPNYLKRSIVIFSDGTDLSNVNSEDLIGYSQIIQQSKDLKIRIHVVMFGAAKSVFLQSLAKETHGEYVAFQQVSDLDPLWNRLQAERVQQVTSYRAATNNEAKIEIIAGNGNHIISDTAKLPSVTLKPFDISLESPLSNAVIKRKSDDLNKTTAAFEPKVLQVQAQVVWPDAYERSITQFGYQIGKTVGVLHEMGKNVWQGEIPLVNLIDGSYTLQVNAKDEFSNTVSKTIPIQIQMIHPSLITTPVLDAKNSSSGNSSLSVTQIATNIVRPTPLSISSGNDGVPKHTTSSLQTLFNFLTKPFLLFALIPFVLSGIGFALWIFLDNSNPQDKLPSSMKAKKAQDDEESTPFLPPPNFHVPAWLIYREGGGGGLPDKLDLKGDIIRIGRKPEWCDIVIEDSRLSRLHATITQEQGKFYIVDEGSTGGTFVNRRKLGVSDKKLLKHNDTINFHEITYKFETDATP